MFSNTLANAIQNTSDATAVIKLRDNLTVLFYKPELITENVAVWLKSHELYGATEDFSSLLLKVYDRLDTSSEYYRNHNYLGHHLTHLWVLCEGSEPIGVAALEESFEYTLQLFVKESCRRQGHGELLLALAMCVECPFGGFYTESSKHLYGKYQLQDFGAGVS